MNHEIPPEKDVQAAIVRDQVHLALRHLPTTQLTSFVVALVLAYSVRNSIPHANIISWILMVLAIVICRIVYYYRYTKARDQVLDGVFWQNAYVVLALVAGIIWGLSAFLIFPAGNLGLISVFVLVITSLSAATTVSHSSLRFGPVAWMAPALLFYAVRCFIAGGEVEYIIGLLIIIYFFALLNLSFNHHKTITASITLRFDNLKLLDEVRKSEERFRLLFQRHAAIMLLVNPETGKIEDANASAERYYGYPVGQLKQMFLQDINILHPTEIQSARLDALNEECNCFIMPHRLASGEVRIVEVQSSPIHIADSILLFSIIQDVTERKRVEERLLASEASYRNLFDSITDAISIHDEDGRILDVNKGAEAMYGQSHDFFLDKPYEALSASGLNDLAVVTQAVRRAFNGDPQLINFWGARSDGNVFPQEVRFVPATYNGRRVVIAVARDASERKRVEAELLRAQKIEAIGVLAGGIAHDFNNLLQSVFGYLAVAKRKIDQRDKALLMLEKADAALQMSAKLTTQLLTFSRGGKPVKRALALGPVIETAAWFALSGSRSGCTFAFSDDLWAVEADDGQIGQVIQNIVLNAEQAMPNGGIVTISARNADLRAASPESVPGPGKWVEIVIRDTGVGISGEHLSRVFEPYYTTKQNGSGLGLATSYSIVKNHGGLIEASSIENKGSVFTIWLPAGGSAVQTTSRSRTDGPIPVRKGRILIMDDEERVRDSVGEMLAELGHSVEFSTDGVSAIEQYRAAQAAGSPFSVVILDATIRGGMGGEETVRQLKKIDPSVVAVISSGYSENAAVSNYAAHGFRAVLPKPYTLESLQAVLGPLIN